MTITQDQLLIAYRSAPEAIQSMYGSEEVSTIISDIGSQYRLPAVISENLERSVGHLLLGLSSPAEFFGNLMLGGTDEQTARGVMEEINQRIFAPLNQQMKAAPQTPQNQEGSEVALSSAVQQEASTELPVPPLMEAPQVAYVPQTLPGSSVPVPAQAVPAMPVYTEPQQYAPNPQSVFPAPNTAPGFSGTKQDPFDVLAVPGTEPLLRSTPPPTPTPPYTPEVATPTQQPIRNPLDVAPQSPIKKEYGADPYREPV